MLRRGSALKLPVYKGTIKATIMLPSRSLKGRKQAGFEPLAFPRINSKAYLISAFIGVSLAVSLSVQASPKCVSRQVLLLLWLLLIIVFIISRRPHLGISLLLLILDSLIWLRLLLSA